MHKKNGRSYDSSAQLNACDAQRASNAKGWCDNVGGTLCIALNKLDEALRELGPGLALVVTPEGVVVDVVAFVPMSRGGVA
jgi:hypothetical protein